MIMNKLVVCDSLSSEDINEIESKIGYVFNDKNILVTAFTHSSICNEKDDCISYERLEFLGDRILGILIADRLYFETNKNVGEMTNLLKGTVSEKPLADVIDKLGLIKYLRHGKSENNNFQSSVKTRSDLFESIIAAIYVDSNKSLVAPSKFAKMLDISKFNDYKTPLQEYVQKHNNGLKPTYDTHKNDDKNDFISYVSVGDRVFGPGYGMSKKDAEQNVAEIAYEKLTK